MGFFDKLFGSLKPEQETAKAAETPAPQPEPAPAPEPEVPDILNLKFGSGTPVAYLTEKNGEPFAAYLKCYGSAVISIEDPEDVKAMGGTKKVEELFKIKAMNSFAKALMDLSSQKVPVARITAYHRQITEFMKNDINEDLSSMFKAKLDDLDISGIVLTEESLKALRK